MGAAGIGPAGPPPAWYTDRGPLPEPFLCEVTLERLPRELARIHRFCKQVPQGDGTYRYAFLAHDTLPPDPENPSEAQAYSMRKDLPRILVCEPCDEAILVALRLLL